MIKINKENQKIKKSKKLKTIKKRISKNDAQNAPLKQLASIYNQNAKEKNNNKCRV